MDHYVTDDEQVEALKKWWRANGGAVVAGILIGLAVIFGWQFWRSHTTSQAEQASVIYDALTRADESSKAAEAEAQANKLIEEFPGTPYATLAGLTLAKRAVEKADYATAAARLQWVTEHADQQAMKDIARLRLVRVMLAQKRIEEAQSQLDQVQDPSFSAEREELKGDLFVARNEPDKARIAYQAALTALAPAGSGAWIKMKLENLQPAAGREKQS